MCEWGLGSVPACDTIATCSSNAWSVQGAASCVNALACPVLEPADQSTCSVPVGTVCDYAPLGTSEPKVRCACERVSATNGNILWYCQKPVNVSCPSPRPRLGTVCSTSATCSYGVCRIPGGNDEACQGGLWVNNPVLCPATP